MAGLAQTNIINLSYLNYYMLYLPTLPGSDSKHGYIVGPIKGNYGFVVKAV